MSQDWIQVGARVVEYNSASFTASVRFAVIERLTATQIVLDNGRRYSRARLRLVGDPYGTELENVTSKRVRAAYTDAVVRNALYEISSITRNKEIRGTAILDTAEAMIGAARKKIRRMERDGDG